MRFCFFLLASLIFAGSVSAKSLALIIGNDTYQTVPRLHKARSDSRGYEAALKSKGFNVTQLEDLNGQAMRTAVAKFVDAIDPGDTVAFIYSGHGWSDGTSNYLLPTDVSAKGSETLIAAESFSVRNGVNGIVDQIHQRGPRLTLVIIDACRDNPFEGNSRTRSIGLTRGLAVMKAPTGTFIAFSASAGQTALDRLSSADNSEYSVFTRHFLIALGKSQSLQQAIKETQVAVNRDAISIGHDQRPAYYDEVVGEACLPPGCATTEDSVNREWQEIKTSKSVQLLTNFALRNEGTKYEGLANERIANLKEDEFPTAEQQPSWCPWAGTTSERAICASRKLWPLDAELNRVYAAMIEGMTRTEVAKKRILQDDWLQFRDRCGENVGCLSGAYVNQIERLKY